MSNYCNFYYDIRTDGYNVALKALSVRYLAFNEHLKYHKINNLRNLTKNNKILKNSNFAPNKS